MVAVLRRPMSGSSPAVAGDWDLAVADAADFGNRLQADFGAPDLCIRRQYVEQRFYEWNQVDLLPVFEWNGVEYLERERFWHDVAAGPDGIPRPRPAHDAFIAWMTGVLWGGRFNPRYREWIGAAWQRDGNEFRQCLERAFGRAWAAELACWLDRGTPEDAARHASGLRGALRWRALLRNPGECLWRQFAHWRTEWRHHLHPPYPWVAFLGPDGSGKSSVIDAVRKKLEGRRIGTRMIHWCPPIRNRPTGGEVVTVPDPHGKAPRNLILSLGKLGLLWWAWLKNGFWALRHPRAKCQLLISDRYYDDLLVDPKRYRYGAPLEWARRVFRLMPKPDRVLVLAGDAGVIHARKQEVTFEELERQMAAYTGLAETIGARASVICCTRPLEQVVEDAYREILRTCRERLPTRATALPPPPLRLKTPGSSLAGTIFPEGGESAEPKTLRVLVSAYACSPCRGAEANVAWNLVRELSARHEMTVITRTIQREAIENSDEDWTGRVRWIYFDPPRWMTFWRQGKHGLAPFYLLWHLMARHRAKDWIRRFGIDLCHHVTIGTYLLPSPLADLGPPLVFGPVGGGERTPIGLRHDFGWRGKFEEWVRDTVRQRLERHKVFHHWYQHTAWAIAATPATEDSLRKIGVPRISMMPQSATGGDVVERYVKAHPLPPKSNDGVLRLVTACRLVHWKAMDLAIRAISLARKEGLDIRLTLLDDGPERHHLQKLVMDEGLGEIVHFTGRLPSLDGVYDRIRSADALIHPALHEAFGQACLESLALGVPVICLDWGGPGLIVDDTCGVRVSPGARDETVRGLADAIRQISKMKADGQDLSAACIQRSKAFQWQDMAEKIDEIYRQVTS